MLQHVLCLYFTAVGGSADHLEWKKLRSKSQTHTSLVIRQKDGLLGVVVLSSFIVLRAAAAVRGSTFRSACCISPSTALHKAAAVVYGY